MKSSPSLPALLLFVCLMSGIALDAIDVALAVLPHSMRDLDLDFHLFLIFPALGFYLAAL